MDETTRAAIRGLQADARSGASELLGQAIAILRHAAGHGADMVEVGRAVGEAQPSMAGMWTAALSALADAGSARTKRQPSAVEGHGNALDAFEQRCRRAGAAMTRVAVETLRPPDGRGLHVITWSFSGSVLACVRALAAPRRTGVAAGPESEPGEALRLRVSCPEGRPMFEGRRLASALAAEGLDVEFFTDAALATAFAGRTSEERVVLLGADAVTPAWMINKVGSGMLAEMAARAGVPVYVAAARGKFVDRRVARLLRIVEREQGEVWDAAPEGVVVRNPYFERMPIDLVSGVITDAGVLAAAMVAEACRAASAHVSDADIARLDQTTFRSLNDAT